jgi:hypothetical protein
MAGRIRRREQADDKAAPRVAIIAASTGATAPVAAPVTTPQRR